MKNDEDDIFISNNWLLEVYAKSCQRVFIEIQSKIKRVILFSYQKHDSQKCVNIFRCE